MEDRGTTSFGPVFDSVFAAMYEPLTFKAADMAENYFKATLATRQQRFLDQYAGFKNAGKDSLSLNAAASLCFGWMNYIVYGAELPVVDELMRGIGDKRYIIQDSVLIPTRDGALISAIIVRSRVVSGLQPVVLKFGIYAEPTEVPETRFIAAHGYIGVIADTRGKRLSPQTVEPFLHDGDDAWDVIDWINKQTWCNGKIGMYGGSYLGFTQWAAVKRVHPRKQWRMRASHCGYSGF